MTDALYAEMRAAAKRERWRAGRPSTWQTTAVIHEAYLKLYQRGGWSSREQFLATAATAMRHVLVDAARARLTEKRGDGVKPLPIEAADKAMLEEDAEVVELGDALTALAAFDPKLAKVVECRFFAGFDEAETGLLMGVSDRTVRRWWNQARAWLHREIQAEV